MEHLSARCRAKSALIAEDIKRFAARVSRGSRIVFPLVEKGSGFLSLEGIVVEADSVHSEDGLALFALKQTGVARGKLFEFANARIDALEDRHWLQLRVSSETTASRTGSASMAWVRICSDKHVVVAVNDQARKKIGLAEDQPIGVRVVHNLLSIIDGHPNAFRSKPGKSFTARSEIMRMAICDELL